MEPAPNHCRVLYTTKHLGRNGELPMVGLIKLCKGLGLVISHFFGLKKFREMPTAILNATSANNIDTQFG